MNIVKADTAIDFAEIDVYQSLAQAYFAIGNSQKGEQYNSQFYIATSKKFKASTAKALQELETKYETQKKELALQKSQARNEQKNIIILSSLGLALLLGLIGYLLYRQQRLRNQQLMHENELKQALTKIENQNNLQQQRIEISKELHDNIGSQLTFIISSLDNLKQFDVDQHAMFEKIGQIGDFTRDTINDLRDTIWAMNKEAISLEDLRSRTLRFIERAQNAVVDTEFEFQCAEQEKNKSVNTRLGIDVYRIIQEAVNNAIKHAQAAKIIVRVHCEQEFLSVDIIDDGKGFDSTKGVDGYGIASMRTRADKIQAQFNIEALQPGTKVSLRIKWS